MSKSWKIETMGSIEQFWESVTKVIKVGEDNMRVQWIFDLSMFDLRKVSRNPFFDLRKKNQAYWGKNGKI